MYCKPVIEVIEIDSNISLILCSDNNDWKHHKPGCPCRHCREIEEYNTDNPY